MVSSAVFHFGGQWGREEDIQIEYIKSRRCKLYKVLCQTLEHPRVSSPAGRGSLSEQCDKDDSSFKQSAGRICWGGNPGAKELGQDGKMCMPVPWSRKGRGACSSARTNHW